MCACAHCNIRIRVHETLPCKLQSFYVFLKLNRVSLSHLGIGFQFRTFLQPIKILSPVQRLNFPNSVCYRILSKTSSRTRNDYFNLKVFYDELHDFQIVTSFVCVTVVYFYTTCLRICKSVQYISLHIFFPTSFCWSHFSKT